MSGHELTLRRALVFVAVSEDCTAPWTEFSGSCYYMSSTEQETEMTWVDARASCMQQGADLVSVNSIAENDFLKGMVSRFRITLSPVNVRCLTRMHHTYILVLQPGLSC